MDTECLVEEMAVENSDHLYASHPSNSNNVEVNPIGEEDPMDLNLCSLSEAYDKLEFVYLEKPWSRRKLANYIYFFYSEKEPIPMSFNVSINDQLKLFIKISDKNTKAIWFQDGTKLTLPVKVTKVSEVEKILKETLAFVKQTQEDAINKTESPRLTEALSGKKKFKTCGRCIERIPVYITCDVCAKKFHYGCSYSKEFCKHVTDELQKTDKKNKRPNVRDRKEEKRQLIMLLKGLKEKGSVLQMNYKILEHKLKTLESNVSNE